MGEPVRNDCEGSLIAELTAEANEVFGSHETTLIWLNTALWELGNISPREIVNRAGQTGLIQARDVLTRIEYGVYS